MPIHSYRCQTCDHVYEKYFNHTKYVTNEDSCENCGNPAQKIIGNGICALYVGAGFSINDMRTQYTKDHASPEGIAAEIARDQKYGKLHQNNVHQWRGTDLKKEKVSTKEVS